jgi:DNA-directed RNA polymerase subunit RPC12/RpoP
MTPLSFTRNDVPCKACGSKALVMQRNVTSGGIVEPAETTTFTCYLCGDGWTTVKRSTDGGVMVDFWHIPQWAPVLHRQTAMPVDPDTSGIHNAEYECRIGQGSVPPDEWHRELERRRRALKNRVAN